jgi:hypothetical protein
MITSAIVTSKDGVPFSVSFYSRTDAQAQAAAVAETRFARTQLASQLDAHGDYHRVDILTGYVEAPAPKLPRPRPRLTLIEGGKS